MSKERMKNNKNMSGMSHSNDLLGMKLTDDELQEVAGGRGGWTCSVPHSINLKVGSSRRKKKESSIGE